MAEGLCGKVSSGRVFPSRMPAIDFVQHELVNAIALVSWGAGFSWLTVLTSIPPPQPLRSAMQCCQILEVLQRIHPVFWVANCFQQAVVAVFILSFYFYYWGCVIFIGVLWCIHLYLNVIVRYNMKSRFSSSLKFCWSLMLMFVWILIEQYHCNF